MLTGVNGQFLLSPTTMRMSSSIFTALLAAAAISGAGSAQEVLCSENFDAMPEGQPPGKPFTGGGNLVAVKAGRLFVGSEKWNPVVTLERPFRGDVAVEVDLRDAGECHWTGVVFKGVYWVTVNRQFGTFACVKRLDGQPGHEMAVRPGYAQYVHNVNSFRLAITQVGKRFQCAIDGKVLLDFEDADAPAEGVLQLVGGYGSKVYFDNLVVRRAERLAEGIRKRSVAPAGLRVRGKLDRPDGICHDGETVKVSFQIDNQSQQDFDTQAEYRLVDYWEQVVAKARRPFRLAAAETALDWLNFSPPCRGVFKVALYLPDARGDMAWATDAISFGVVPRSVGETPPNPDSFFGAHAEQQNPDFHLAFVKKLGAKWVRCHDIIQMTWWEIVEPEDDKWNWRDEQCATIRKHGFHILGEFCMTPAWAARVPDGGVKDRRDLRTYPPKSWDEYAEYVYETVNHFKRDVRHWEVWNEPNHSGFWRGTPEEYAHLLKVTYQAAKKADPTCVIVGVGGVALSQMPWLERAFAAGLTPYMDDMSTHGYVDAVTPMDMLETESRLPAFRALLRKHDFPPYRRGSPAGGRGGLWDSEHSVIGTSFIDDFRLDHLEEDAPYHFRRAAETMMKTYVFEVAQGYKRVFPYMTKWLARNDNEAA
ncbi:MAG: hypothetical protein FJ278_12560, partial [Planctomycetes bacterium]|nr:hypothetical protein [Planctomycetota bacterium]